MNFDDRKSLLYVQALAFSQLNNSRMVMAPASASMKKGWIIAFVKLGNGCSEGSVSNAHKLYMF